MILGTDPLLDLQPQALSTHAFVLGMTGSGKTGLCVVLVEELLRAGVPVIAVDSKGDLATLLLSFDAADPRVAEWGGDRARLDAARSRLGLTTEAWAQLRASYEPRLYTPGSTLGLSVDLLGTLAPPADAAPDSLAEAADVAARSLLGLVNLEADPLTSREYLLLVQLLSTAWAAGQTPTLVDLVKQVATPPFAAVGALPLEDFFPQRDRQGLMVRLNGLLASPKFAAWRQGEALDPARLVRAPDGRPRLSVYSVAHLSDEERVFAVAQLLERTQGWMRKQGGSPGLRAVLLLDEIFGYFPPAPANPPTKTPLLGLLKQARAFGVSVVLATQNPIDLDYRGLANIGTWLVGRLQSEQDKARIKDALAAAKIDEAELSRLEPRQFLLHSVHRPAATVFRTRDALTVLHGPFSADEVKRLAAPMKEASAAAARAPGGAEASTAASTVTGGGALGGAVVGGGAVGAAVGGAALGGAALGSAALGGAALGGAGVGVSAGGAALGGAALGGGAVGGPALGGAGGRAALGSTGLGGAAAGAPGVLVDPELGPLYEADRGTALPFLLLKFGVRYRLGSATSEETIHELAFPLEGTMSPAEALEGAPLSVKGVPFQATQPDGMTLGAAPAWVSGLKAAKLTSVIKERLPAKLETKLLEDPTTRLISGPTETAEAFAARVVEKQGVSRERQKLVRDLERKRIDLAQAEKEVSSRKAEKWLDVGAGVLGLFSGRRVSSSLGGVGRALAANRYQGNAEAKVEDLALEVQQLEKELAHQEAVDPRRFVEQLAVPRSSDVQVLRLALTWIVP